MVLVLKIKYAKKEQDKQLLYVRKDTYLGWGNEYEEWYIIPTFSINVNDGFTITFQWLKLQYSHNWNYVTYEEGDEWAAVHYKVKNKV